MYRKILVPLDGSSFGEAALAHARELAHCTGAEIALVRVAIQPLYEYATDPLLFQTVREDTEAASAEYLQRVAAELSADGFTATVETCTGPVAETILDYAQEIQADLIVMSTHGRSGLARWFIGSIADKIVRASTLPVLLVRPFAA
ncbi:MAG: universal stress protein [Anaerolineae bacterium]